MCEGQAFESEVSQDRCVNKRLMKKMYSNQLTNSSNTHNPTPFDHSSVRPLERSTSRVQCWVNQWFGVQMNESHALCELTLQQRIDMHCHGLRTMLTMGTLEADGPPVLDSLQRAFGYVVNQHPTLWVLTQPREDGLWRFLDMHPNDCIVRICQSISTSIQYEDHRVRVKLRRARVSLGPTRLYDNLLCGTIHLGLPRGEVGVDRLLS